MDRGAEEIYTFDQLILSRAEDEDQIPLFAYPKSRLGITDYEFFTGAKINSLIDGAAKNLIKTDIPPVVEETVVGIYSTSDLDYLINIYALGRLGYSCFLISPRLPASIVARLIVDTNAKFLFFAPEYGALVQKAGDTASISTRSLLSRTSYENQNDNSPVFSRNVPPIQEQGRRYIMLHSSGTTGLPKPVHYTNKRLLITCLTSPDLIAFQSLPFSHAHGLVTYSQAIWSRKTIYLFNSHVPQTNRNLCAAIEAARPEIVWTVPYVLKLMAETDRGIEALKQCKVVSSSGSRCPDELGDLLTKRGVFLGCLFGSTETSLLFTSLTRPRNDKYWNYLRTPPHVHPYILMKPISEGSPVCECIVLDGHRGKYISNSNDPPSSFHTSDLFIAHTSIPNAWKFLGRADDRVTLLNGEKVLPLPIEGRIMQDALVKEVVVFGVDREIPGLLVFKADTEDAKRLSYKEYIDRIWPSIQDANAHAEKFSQIGMDMIIVLGSDVEYPSTDKSTIKRAQVYDQFSTQINEAYARLENNIGKEGEFSPDFGELKCWLVARFRELGFRISSDTDFFAAGIDSLKATQMRGIILRDLNLGGRGSSLPNMILYECGNVENLANKIIDTRKGRIRKEDDTFTLMSKMIQHYSVMSPRPLVSEQRPEKAVVILTGATGFLGSQILSQLIAHPEVSKIYALIRIPPSSTPSAHLSTSLARHSLSHLLSSSKLHTLSSILTTPNLGLDASTFFSLRKETTHIIHCAWTVNFALRVGSFAADLLGLENLLSFSLFTESGPARFIFTSSIASSLNYPSHSTPPISNIALVPSTPLVDPSNASSTGYGQSKFIAEAIIQKTVLHDDINGTILRLGQLIPSHSPDTTKLWNPNELVPLIIHSSKVTGVLPDRGTRGDECRWLSVDVAATLVLDLCFLHEPEYSPPNTQGDKALLYNAIHRRPFSWRNDFLPKLKEAGVDFEVVGYEDWIVALKESETDVARKLLGALDELQKGGDRTQGVEGEVRFDTTSTEDLSRSFREASRAVDRDLVCEMVRAWCEIW